MSKFEYVNFKINKKYFKFFYDNPKYYIFLKFSKFKNVVLKSVHWLGGSLIVILPIYLDM